MTRSCYVRLYPKVFAAYDATTSFHLNVNYLPAIKTTTSDLKSESIVITWKRYVPL